MLTFTYPFLVNIIKSERMKNPTYIARAPDLGLELAFQEINLEDIKIHIEEALYWFLRTKLETRQKIPPHNPNISRQQILDMQGCQNTYRIWVTTKINLEDNIRPDIADIQRKLDDHRINHFGYIDVPAYNIRIGVPCHNKH